MNSTCVNAYPKTLEGLALYFSNLNFQIDVKINFNNTFLRKEPNDTNYRYQHFVDGYSLKFRPRFLTFYNENECLIKILIPDSYLTIGGRYIDSTVNCEFKLLALNESFLPVKIKKDDLDKMSLDFNIAYSKSLNKIREYCENELSKLNHGMKNIDNSWIIKTDYNDLSLQTKYL